MPVTIPVTKAFLPPFQDVVGMLQGIWDSGQLTNNGPLLKQLEAELVPHHGTPHVLLASNGTITLQLALRAFGITGEVITTPFSYVASTTAILWERCTPVFVDIEPDGFNIDADLIERAITPRTQAILATHVYGLPCNVEAIADIAARHGLKVIYDAAHAFGTRYRGRPLLSQGDISSCSFHATKIFHTVEGGSLACADPALHRKLGLMRAFGHIKDEHFEPGINAKNSELHAAVGLLVLRHFPAILERRRAQWLRYAAGLRGMRIARVPAETEYNHSYFPLVLDSERAMHQVVEALAAIGVAPRRYFYPALSNLPYVTARGSCPIAESLALRVICLPLYHDLGDADIDRVIAVVRASV
ncbi:MAG: DegT/DnrJ/EryC1/StrS family aminotransferase [Flavobacteriales bacterium]|nr:MAG: DegT/DnrJ/EryC1/StrS family aminotransferase [Flavobacteriales bacterium]